jgi:hypothetical protein
MMPIDPAHRLAELAVAEHTGTIAEAEATELAHAGHHAHAQRELAVEAAMLTAAAFCSAPATAGSAPALPPSLMARLQADADRCLAAASPRSAQSAPAQRSEPKPIGRITPSSGRRVILPWLVAAAASVIAAAVWLGGPAGSSPATGSLLAKLDAAADKVELPFGSEIAEYKGVTGTVRWSPSAQVGEMTFKGLKPLDSKDAVYQLWIVDPSRDKHPVDGGVLELKVAADGTARVPFTPRLPVNKAAAFAITKEKPGGVVVSAGPLLLVAAAK